MYIEYGSAMPSTKVQFFPATTESEFRVNGRRKAATSFLSATILRTCKANSLQLSLLCSTPGEL